MMFSSNQFDFNPTSLTFVAEISELQAQGRSVFEQIYPDSADLGLILISAHTGHEVKYCVESTDGVDGEIAGWRLKPTADSVRRVPGCRGTSVLIIND